MTKSPRKNVPEVGIELGAACMPSELASDRATAPGEREGNNLFWSIKTSSDVLNKFKSKDFKAFTVSIYYFNTLHTTLPHHLIKENLIDLNGRKFLQGTHFIWLVSNNVFVHFDVYKTYKLWSCQKACECLLYLLDNTFIRFRTKFYR